MTLAVFITKIIRQQQMINVPLFAILLHIFMLYHYTCTITKTVEASVVQLFAPPILSETSFANIPVGRRRLYQVWFLLLRIAEYVQAFHAHINLRPASKQVLSFLEMLFSN